ncbi:putative transcriptional regulator [Azospira oryzae PS]|uniref:Putative transcriptional regulator n=1 Tax=Azospira oryzae (strain ATCC BAA-33 / DSM 13638 / PS) TaxID=640081 RepID=G8QM75_AZOOP|nr:AlpA family transcriptional regulator [Azospira oryzae]AEV24591.1 putative transcriptional regulator [Azospira oryzae PS]
MSPNDRIIRLPDVEKAVGLKKSAIYKLIKAGEFPHQLKLGKHASGWLEADVQAWIRKKAGRESANDEQPQAA